MTRVKQKINEKVFTDAWETPTDAYAEFLHNKAISHKGQGIEVRTEDLNSMLFDFQKAIVVWALMKGRAAIFSDCGTGKTPMQLVWADEVCRRMGVNALILAPLAVAAQTAREGEKFGIHVTVCRAQDDCRSGINITNYEMLEHFDPAYFGAIVIDESGILKSFTGKFKQAIIEFALTILYKLACSATPAPNDHEELGNHAEFLGIMSRIEMLATYFVHDGGNTSQWRLKGHAEELFWRWVAGWAVALRTPADIGFDGSAYVLPKLHFHEHCITVADDKVPDSLLLSEAVTLTEQRASKRGSLEDRCCNVAELIASEPNEQWVVWCELNDEGDLLEKLIPGSVQIAGRHTNEQKEERILGFIDGKFNVLITKGKIAGFGLNLQCCARTAWVGVTHSWEALYQELRRFYRFGQLREVHAHLIYADAEAPIVRNLRRKEKDAEKMQSALVGIMRSVSDVVAPTERETIAYRPSAGIKLPSFLKGE